MWQPDAMPTDDDNDNGDNDSGADNDNGADNGAEYSSSTHARGDNQQSFFRSINCKRRTAFLDIQRS